MSHMYPIDPQEVLSLEPNATLEQIQLAYRKKASRHHPDAGGEAWAFKVVSEAYRIVCVERMSHRVHIEERHEEQRERMRAEAAEPHASDTPHPPQEPTTDARRTMRDNVSDPLQLVDIEFFTIRYALTDLTDLLRFKPEERTLSCNLNMTWPSREAIDADIAIPSSPKVGKTIKTVTKAFESVARKTRSHASQVQAGTDSVSAWARYPTQVVADNAFHLLRDKLREQGLGVAQWMREMTIPREPQ